MTSLHVLCKLVRVGPQLLTHIITHPPIRLIGLLLVNLITYSPTQVKTMAFVSRFLHIQPIRSGLVRFTSRIRTQTTAGRTRWCMLDGMTPAPPILGCTTSTLSYVSDEVLFISLVALAAAPEVYTVIPPQPLEKKPGQLQQWQLEEFFDKGFVNVPKFFTEEELQPVLEVRR